VIVPGLTFGAGSRVAATIGAGTTADFINQGVGFMNGGNLAIDTNVPAVGVYDGGIAQNASGAIHGTTVQAATDVWVQGVRVSALGQLIYESADAATFSSGNPITAAGNFAVN
jgi:hypothetical protein